MSLSLLQLEEIVNSEESLNRQRHNQEVFFEQNEFKKLVNKLKLNDLSKGSRSCAPLQQAREGARSPQHYQNEPRQPDRH